MKTKKRRFFAQNKILCFMLSLLLLMPATPVRAAFVVAADESGALSGVTTTDNPAAPPEGSELQACEELEADKETLESTAPPEGFADAELQACEELEESQETENACTNHISGVLWLDMDEDGIYDESEPSLAGYTVYLYVEDDTASAVQTTTTDAEGKYLFENVNPGRYIVGVKPETIEGTEYLLPLAGISGDNRFAIDMDSWMAAYTEPIELEPELFVTDMDAGMRTPPQIEPCSGPYDAEINLTTGTITGDSAGISDSGGVITFSAAASGKNFRLFGTTRRVAVNTSISITLDGVTISGSTPIKLGNSVVLNLTLAAGTTNTLTAGADYAGIMVPSNATLNIDGDGDGSGKLNATGGKESAGIGSVADSACGTITISGGTITATGGEEGAGIGGGKDGKGGAITISGGTVIAKGGEGANGIGPGEQGSPGTNTFLGGSVFPTRNGSAVSVNPVPKNASVSVYMTTVTVRDASNLLVANALVSVALPTYSYTAHTNSAGVAYIWLPLGSTLFEAEHEAYGYGAETATVASANNAAVTIYLGMRTTLLKTPDAIAFITDINPTPVTLTIKAENVATGTLSEIVSAQWFRVETTDTTHTASPANFHSAYLAAPDTNKGSDTTNLTETAGGTATERSYTLPVSQNATYWVMVHYKDGLGVDRYQVKSIVIDNIYTQSTGQYKGVSAIDDSVLYEEDIPSLTGNVGVAFELDSSAILGSTANGATAVAGTGAQFTVTPKDLSTAWTASPASHTVSVNGTELATAVFTYSLNQSAILVSFDAQGGTPDSISERYYMPGDLYGTLPVVTKEDCDFLGWYTHADITEGTLVDESSTVSAGMLYAQWDLASFIITEKYVDESGAPISGQSDTTTSVPGAAPEYSKTIPDTMTGYKPVGYRVGHASFAEATPYMGTTASIPNVTEDETVYFVYHEINANISVTFPAGMDFYVDQTTYPSVASGALGSAGAYYTFINHSDKPVYIKFVGMTVTTPDGLTFVADANTSGGNSDIHLNLELPADAVLGALTNGFTSAVMNIDPLTSYSSTIGTLDGAYEQQPAATSQCGYVAIGGHYAGMLSTAAKTPNLTFVFEYDLAT